MEDWNFSKACAVNVIVKLAPSQDGAKLNINVLVFTPDTVTDFKSNPLERPQSECNRDDLTQGALL